MRLLKFVPIKLTVFLITGILIGRYSDIHPNVLFLAILISTAALGFVFFKEKRTDTFYFGILTGLLTIGIGALVFTASLPKNHKDHYSHKNLNEEHIWQVKIKEILKSNTFSDRYIAATYQMDDTTVSGKILINILPDSLHPKMTVDQELLIRTKINVISSPLNPHQFNYANYMKSLGIYHQITLESEQYSYKEYGSSTIYGMAAGFRDNIIATLQQENFGKEELSIIQALLLGQRLDISNTTYTHYKDAGAVHILAVSGLHIGILLLLLQFILRPLELLPHGKSVKLIIIIILLWGFALLAGFSASIVRSVTMFSFVAYAQFLNRPANSFNILALSMFFILLIFDPSLLFQVGFQMSYAAVFAIVWIYPLLQKFWYPKFWLPRKIWQLLSVSISAQLGVLPISLFYFHQFPGLFFVSNLVLIPFLGLILGMGILLIILALCKILPEILVTFYNAIIALMNHTVSWVAQQEVFIFKEIPFDIIQLLLTYFLIITGVWLCYKFSYKKTVLFLSAILVFQAYAIYYQYHLKQEEKLFVMHRTGHTALFNQLNSKLYVYTSDSSAVQKIAVNYSIAERIHTLSYTGVKNSYRIKKKTLFILDSLAIYPSNTVPIDYLLLTQSPKIHLDQLLDSISPKMVIADGSNYRSNVIRWAESCRKRKLPFHYTGEKGAYYFNVKD